MQTLSGPRAAFRHQPTAREVCALLERAVAKAGAAPRHIVSDQGAQFRMSIVNGASRTEFGPRFGAVGQHGSIAIIERFIPSLKNEFLRRLVLPYRLAQIEVRLGAYQVWYNEQRSHAALNGRTPAEVRDGRVPLREGPRFEPRARYPLARGDPLARRVGKLELVVSHVDNQPHLPVVGLREAA